MRIELDNPWLYALLISVLAIIIWLIFQPGFMNGDAMVIYAQASNESYHDWHPPVMAFVLRGFFNIGLGLSELMLVQCLLAYLGLYGFSYQLLNILKVSKSALKGFLIVIFLSTPVFPFPFYTMAFLKDLWCAMAFLWLMLLAFYLHHQPSFKYNTFKFWSILGLMIFFMVLAILARHNALVLFPVFIGIIYNICKKARMQVGLSIACSMIPILLYWAFNFYAYNIRNVQHRYPERQVYAAELIGLIKQDSSKCESMNYLCDYLTDNWRDAYEYGEVSAVMIWGWKHSVKFPEFNRDDPRLTQDYYHSLKKYPFSMSLVKLKSFAHMLKPSRHKYWFHRQLDENKFGLKMDKTFESVRNSWLDFTLKTKKPLFIVTADHPIWILLNILFLILLWTTRRMTRLPNIFTYLLLIPTAYYFSYLLAATTWHYRFMYPSTLIIQVYTISLCMLIMEKREAVKNFLSDSIGKVK